MKKSPFVKTPRPEIVPVGNQETGFVYLLKKNGLSPCENPVDMQKASRKQAQTTALIYEAVKAYAERHDVSESIARDIVLSSKPSLNFADYLDEASKVVHQKLIDEVSAKYAEKESLDKKEAQAIVQQVLSPSIGAADVNLFEYLGKESTTAYLELVGDTRELPYKAATLMLRYRTCYPVELATMAKAKDSELKVKPLMCGFQKGDCVRFGSTLVTVTGVAEEGDETLSIDPSGMNLTSGSIGFKIDFETNSELHGIPSWADEDTSQMLMESQIQAIYRFYQSEAGQLSDEEIEGQADVGNLPKQLSESTSSPQVPATNGNGFTGDSKALELQTIA